MNLSSRMAVFMALCAAAACGSPSVKPADGSGGRPGGGGGGSAGGGQGAGGTSGGGGGIVLPDAAPAEAPPSGMPTEGMNCGLSKIQLKSGPAQLLLVLDRSGSMAQVVSPAQPVQKWGEVVSALDTVLSRTQEAIAWGLKLYPVATTCGVPDGLTVPLAERNHMAIMTAINANRPYLDGGATPTQAAVMKSLELIKASPLPRTPYLVVATDGIPNCTMGLNGNSGPEDPAGAIAAVQASAAAGVPAFIVGIATAGTTADTTLNSMAEAGGRPRPGATKYYPVASRDEIAAALSAIGSEVASCTFPLSMPPPVPDNVAVDVNGQRVMRDPAQQNGWYYGAGNMSIVLVGPPCETAKLSASTDVKIIFGCPNQVIP